MTLAEVYEEFDKRTHGDQAKVEDRDLMRMSYYSGAYSVILILRQALHDSKKKGFSLCDGCLMMLREAKNIELECETHNAVLKFVDNV